MQPFGSQFWNDRFNTEDYVFGREPAVFLREHAHRIPAGSRVLVPADGEGRNSVFLAKHGHEVHATDIAEHGIAKARRLAKDHDVRVDFRHADIHEWDWPEAAYDAVAAVFIQFSPPELRPRVFAGIERTLRPGGLLLLHGYTTKQIEYGTGGPPRVEHLYSEALLRDAFDGWEILRLEAYERELHEGSRHVGQSALIDLIARRPG
ncbi:Tellurite methyltransferase [Enhygromyxa salina]|uniref:Tellurite methyltransferase n=1 Tax=Enhygromyxa salina TaxID=215803 RepID=A0A2S9YBQ5_9BACT|nr:class I SAM-dependent methyltransferase [Enhygromyxa salina]PRQ02535.1 Tellurite methyltransferase [Enhygromyxa salina]